MLHQVQLVMRLKITWGETRDKKHTKTSHTRPPLAGGKAHGRGRRKQKRHKAPITLGAVKSMNWVIKVFQLPKNGYSH